MRCVCQTGTGYWAKATVRPFTDEEEEECRIHAMAMSRASGRWTSARRLTDSRGRKTLEQHRHADLVGARGEKAWSIFWGVPWPKRINDFKDPDFDPDIEVRTTEMDPPTLIIRSRDVQKADRLYCLLHSDTDGRIHLLGWVRPREILDDYRPRRLHDLDDGAPARFIPHWALHRFPFYFRSPKKHRSPV
jgi:hypothetical protein